jgi:hypothetical protein
VLRFVKEIFGVARDAVLIVLKVALVFVRTLGVFGVVIAAFAFALVLALYGAGYFHTLTRYAIEKYMSSYTRTECRVGRVEGSLLTGLDIYDFVIGDGPSLERDGPALAIDEIHVRYDPLRFVRRDATIDYVHCVRPRLVLRKEADGRINLGRIFGPKGPPEGKGVYFVIADVFLEDAYFKMELNSPLTEFSHADVRCTFTKARGAVFIDLRHCSCYFPEFGQRIPHFGSGSLAINARLMHFGGVDVASRNTSIATYGTIKFKPETYLELRFKADPLDVGEAAQGVFADPPEFFGRGRYEGTLTGTTDKLEQRGILTLDDGYLYGFDLEDVITYYDFDIPAKRVHVNGFEGRVNRTPTYVKMTMDLSGERPVYWGEARLLRMNLADYVASSYFETDVDARLHFSGAGLSAGDYAIDASVYLSPGRLGPLLIEGGNADFRYAGAKVFISGLFLRVGGGDLYVKGSGDPEALDLEVEARSLPIAAFAAGDKLRGLKGLVSFEGRISGPNNYPSFEGGVVFKDLTYERLAVGSARAEGYWKDYGGDDRAELHVMAWDVRAGPAFIARFLGDLSITDDTYVLRDGYLETAEGDTARLDLGYDARAGRAELTRLELDLGGTHAALTKPVVLTREGNEYVLGGGVLRYQGGEFSLTGAFSPRGGPLNLVAEARGVPLGDLMPANAGVELSGTLDRVRLDVGGSTRDISLYANLAASNLILNGQPIEYVHGEASYEKNRIVIPGIVAGLLGGTLRASAYLPLTAFSGEGDAPVDVTVWFSRFKMAALTGLYEPGLVEEGYVDGVITASGTAASPAVRGNLLLSELRWSGVSFAKGRADFSYRDGVVDIRELSLSEKTLPNVVVTGKLPLALGRKEVPAVGEMALKADFTDLDLRVANPVSDEVFITGGKIRGRMELSGTYERPVFFGRVQVLEGEGAVRVLRSSFSGLTGTVETREGRLSISPEDPLTFALDGGEGRVWGNVGFEGFRPVELDITLDIHDYVVRAISGVQALGDISANISGPVGRPQATAEVTLTSGLVTLDFGGASPAVGGASPAGSMDYEVHVTAPGNLWLRNKDAEIELEADLTVRRTGGVTYYTGDLTSRRGYYYFLKRDFTVEQADITFTGTQELNPVIKLRARREIRAMRADNPDAVVYVDVTGTLREPVVQLSYELKTGQPVGLSQEEITMVLALDVTWEDYNALSSGELASKGSSDYVRHYAEGEVARAVRRETGVDVFTFDANVFTGEAENPYAEFTVGQHLTPGLFVSYTGKYQEYGSGGTASPALEHAAEVDYELRRDFYVVGSTYEDDGSQRYGLGLRFIHKY